jgi:hypothetical protein
MLRFVAVPNYVRYMLMLTLYCIYRIGNITATSFIWSLLIYQAENRRQRHFFKINLTGGRQCDWFVASFLCGFAGAEQYICRKIRLIESNVKCRYLKNWLVKGLCGRCVPVGATFTNPLSRCPISPRPCVLSCPWYIFGPRIQVVRCSVVLNSQLVLTF